jgi:hypothetical protein
MSHVVSTDAPPDMSAHASDRVRVTFGRHFPLSMAKATFPCAFARRHGRQVNK